MAKRKSMPRGGGRLAKMKGKMAAKGARDPGALLGFLKRKKARSKAR